MNAKTLIARYLAAFWAVMVVAFLALQVAHDLAKDHSKAANPTSKEYFLIASHSAPAPDLAPDLKALQIWFQHEGEVFVLVGKPCIKTGFEYCYLFNIRLIRLLRDCISINAP